MLKDGHAIPKVIDFGVAKAMSHTLTDKTIFTEHGQIIGTPEYMSPEQAEMGATDRRRIVVYFVLCFALGAIVAWRGTRDVWPLGPLPSFLLR